MEDNSEKEYSHFAPYTMQEWRRYNLRDHSLDAPSERDHDENFLQSIVAPAYNSVNILAEKNTLKMGHLSPSTPQLIVDEAVKWAIPWSPNIMSVMP